MKTVPEGRQLRYLCVALVLVGVLPSSSGLLGGGAARSFATAAPGRREPAAEIGKYTGPGSCSSTSCHGSVKPRAESRVLQNEYSTWVVKDKHSKAYAALTGRRHAGGAHLG